MLNQLFYEHRSLPFLWIKKYTEIDLQSIQSFAPVCLRVRQHLQASYTVFQSHMKIKDDVKRGQKKTPASMQSIRKQKQTDLKRLFTTE